MAGPSGAILVVDDTSKMREVLDTRLGQEGFDVSFVESGEKALELMAKRSYDLVLLGMSNKDGFKVLRRIREKFTQTQLPVIMVADKDQDVVGALEKGANDYITKPFELSEVLARIKTQLALVDIGDGGKRGLEERIDVLELEERERLESIVKRRNSYLIKEKGYSRSIGIFSNLTKYGSDGLLLTTKNPDVIKETYNMGESKGMFFWLSSSAYNEDGTNPSNLTEIHQRVSNFMRNKKDSITLFLGLETMVTLNEFEKVFRFLTTLVDLATIEDSRMIISVDPETMNPRELSLLESTLSEITEDDLEGL